MAVAPSSPRQPVDLLITGGLVVTMDPARRVIADGAVAVAHGRVAAVGDAAEVASAVDPRRSVDACHKIVLPGLIDAHAHAGHSLLRAIGADLPTAEWARMVDRVYFRATTPEFWYTDGLLSGLERLRFGTTTAVMMLGSEPRTDDPAYGDAFARGVARPGGRTLISVGPPGPPWPKVFTRWNGDRAEDREIDYDRCLAVTEELIRHWNTDRTSRIGAMVGPPRFSVPSGQDFFFDVQHLDHAQRQARDIRALADRCGVFIHTHAYGGVVEYLEEHLSGILGPDVMLVHCTGLSPNEIDILARVDSKVVHCPTARRPYLGPRCPVPELIDAGVTVAVATDAAAPDRSFDLLETMRTAQRLQRVHFLDPNVLPPEKMLETVTVDAARAIGLGGEVGSLEAGKRADIVLVDRHRPHTSPSLLPIWQLVQCSTGQDVTDVFVDGQAVVVDGRCTTVAESEVLDAADRESAQMIRRAGIEALLERREPAWGKSRG